MFRFGSLLLILWQLPLWADPQAEESRAAACILALASPVGDRPLVRGNELAFLEAIGKGATVPEIVKAAKIHRKVVSSTARRLHAAGWIQIVETPGQRDRRLYVLTDAGRELLGRYPFRTSYVVDLSEDVREASGIDHPEIRIKLKSMQVLASLDSETYSTIGELANQLDLPRSHVSVALGELEFIGLVERNPQSRLQFRRTHAGNVVLPVAAKMVRLED